MDKQQRKINKKLFFLKVNITDKLLRVIKEKEKKNPHSNIRNKKGNSNADSTDI